MNSSNTPTQSPPSLGSTQTADRAKDNLIRRMNQLSCELDFAFQDPEVQGFKITNLNIFLLNPYVRYIKVVNSIMNKIQPYFMDVFITHDVTLDPVQFSLCKYPTLGGFNPELIDDNVDSEIELYICIDERFRTHFLQTLNFSLFPHIKEKEIKTFADFKALVKQVPEGISIPHALVLYREFPVEHSESFLSTFLHERARLNQLSHQFHDPESHINLAKSLAPSDLSFQQFSEMLQKDSANIEKVWAALKLLQKSCITANENFISCWNLLALNREKKLVDGFASQARKIESDLICNNWKNNEQYKAQRTIEWIQEMIHSIKEGSSQDNIENISPSKSNTTRSVNTKAEKKEMSVVADTINHLSIDSREVEMCQVCNCRHYKTIHLFDFNSAGQKCKVNSFYRLEANALQARHWIIETGNKINITNPNIIEPLFKNSVVEKPQFQQSAESSKKKISKLKRKEFYRNRTLGRTNNPNYNPYNQINRRSGGKNRKVMEPVDQNSSMPSPSTHLSQEAAEKIATTILSQFSIPAKQNDTNSH